MGNLDDDDGRVNLDSRRRAQPKTRRQPPSLLRRHRSHHNTATSYQSSRFQPGSRISSRSRSSYRTRRDSLRFSRRPHVRIDPLVGWKSQRRRVAVFRLSNHRWEGIEIAGGWLSEGKRRGRWRRCEREDLGGREGEEKASFVDTGVKR